MEYFDSDVLFNCVAEQEILKHRQATDLIQEALKSRRFVVSTLVITEVGYGLARFHVPNKRIRQELDFYQSLHVVPVIPSQLSRALELAEK
ncbi:PIN domain-containing protein [Larkinella soli]|uniref:PIN domain-containing protein n=1 Tax=Larkinella soli TaxID=1770527 RepID=UPI000FFBB7F1